MAAFDLKKQGRSALDSVPFTAERATGQFQRVSLRSGIDVRTAGVTNTKKITDCYPTSTGPFNRRPY